MRSSALFTAALAALPAYGLPGTVSEDNIIAERDAGAIQAIISGAASAMADGSTYKAPGALGSDPCGKDKCCVWSYIVSDMVPAFLDGQRCGDLARGAVRLGFHDAAAWNASLPYGGADGSILLTDELARPENKGLEAIAGQTKAWFDKYKGYGITMADLIQFGANVATVVCPGGPRIKSYVGRKDSTTQPPPGLLPSPFQTADVLLQLFGAKTISPPELIALMGAHSVSRQFNVDPRRAGAPQDSSPGSWDTTYYRETAADRPPRGVFRFPSDVSLAHDQATSGTWQSFAAQGAQPAWNVAYAQAYFKMSMFGVKNLDELTECSAVLPLPR
ncbi:putative ligninase h2 precursor protein [Echria macrotheca]|uniref:Peroxidase n=1 Tax=Echria macrotheca TaxID=438768 RepID=A0AAJ0B9P5_9PEZI|nr:putative ligninase h2 precursor protein [Echria macrotheca]